MQRDDRANKCADVNHMHLIIGLNREILDNTINLEIREQVENVLEIVNNRRIVSEFSTKNILKVFSHLLDSLSQCLKRLDLISDLLGKLSLRSILNISEEMLNTNLFSFSSTNCARNMDELSHQVSIVINFFLSAVCFSGDAWSCCFVNLNKDKHWVGVVLTQDFIYIDVCLLNGRAT